MDVRSLYGLALDVTTLAVLELVKRYPASGEKLPEDRNSVELVLWEVKDLFRRFELGRLVDEEEFLEACFEVLRLPGVPVRVGGACEEAGLETLRNVFTDPDASVLFITSRGLDVFEDVMDGLGMDPRTSGRSVGGSSYGTTVRSVRTRSSPGSRPGSRCGSSVGRSSRRKASISRSVTRTT